MNDLMKLKQDRDVLYLFACTAYGQQFVNAQLWEGNTDAKTIENIAEAKQILGQLDKTSDRHRYDSEGCYFEH